MPHLPTLKGGSPRTAKPVFVYVVRTERRIRWIRRRVQPLTRFRRTAGAVIV
jgi:hypothetical protein